MLQQGSDHSAFSVDPGKPFLLLVQDFRMSKEQPLAVVTLTPWISYKYSENAQMMSGGSWRLSRYDS